MLYRSGIIALSLSTGIAILTLMFLSLFSGITGEHWMVSLLVVFVVAFILIYSFLHYAVIPPVQRATETVNRLGEDNIVADQGQEPALASLRRLSSEIAKLVDAKQNEIDRLKTLEAFRKDFIADVSHELKTPIFAAQGFIHTLLDGAVKDKSVRKKFLKKAAKSLDGLDHLVQDLLTLSQIETGQIRMRFENFDLRELTEEVLEPFRERSSKKEVELRIDAPSRRVMVYADRQRISQVISNLVSNAIKHSGKEGEVVVSFRVKKTSVITRVTDFGEGIPPEHLGRIFERFYRVDKSRSREKGGTGLGLAIVKHILEGHRTRAEVESEPGKGSTFSFRLPRARSDNDDNGKDRESGKDEK